MKTNAAKNRPSAWAAMLEILLAVAIGIAVLAFARGWFANSLAGDRIPPRATTVSESRT